MQNIPVEGFWLTATLAMTAAFWIPYIANRMIERGVFSALWDPHGETHATAQWADRMMRAHKNAIENLCVFAPLVILAILFERLSSNTAIATEVYFFARLGHFIVFSAGLPVVRVLLFLVGFGCQCVLVSAILASVQMAGL